MGVPELLQRGRSFIRGEWPAALAVATLVLTHLALTGISGEAIPPFGLPMIAAIAVFLLGELLRRWWTTG